jgi:hypothetical protein
MYFLLKISYIGNAKNIRLVEGKKMSIKANEDKLFLEWASKRENFVYDGVVDEETYLATDKKVLFLLKEANKFSGDLKDVILGSKRRSTWDNIYRWTFGIQNIEKEIPWKELAKVDLEKRSECLKSIAIMNLKKYSGGHTADNSLVAKIAKEDQSFLKKQFSLYNADIVIACGVTTAAQESLFNDKEILWKETKRGIGYFEYESGKYFVAFSHPEARAADQLLYYGLIDAIKEIFSNS